MFRCVVIQNREEKTEVDKAKNSLTDCQDPICHSAQILPTLHSLIVDGLAPTCCKHTESSMGCEELDSQIIPFKIGLSLYSIGV